MSDDALVDESAEDSCPICLNILFAPVKHSCGQAYCESCWERLAASAKAEDQDLFCPTCRAPASTNQPRDTQLEAGIRAKYPDEWNRRYELMLQAVREKARIAQHIDAEAQAKAAAELEAAEADEQVIDGRVTRRMTAGLLRRHAREQSNYRTLTLCSKLVLTLEGLRDLSPDLADYYFLTSLNLDHNLLISLDGLRLPQLKVLSVHHNRLHSLGDSLQGVPLLLQLNVGNNRLNSLDGVQHLKRLTYLLAPHNALAEAEALRPLVALSDVLSQLELNENKLVTLDDLKPLSDLAELRTLRLSGNPALNDSTTTPGAPGRTLILSQLPQVRILDGSKNIEAEQRERKMTMAARQQSISRSQAAMVERKRAAERRRIEQYGEGSEIWIPRSVGSDGATPETTPEPSPSEAAAGARRADAPPWGRRAAGVEGHSKSGEEGAGGEGKEPWDDAMPWQEQLKQRAAKAEAARMRSLSGVWMSQKTKPSTNGRNGTERCAGSDEGDGSRKDGRVVPPPFDASRPVAGGAQRKALTATASAPAVSSFNSQRDDGGDASVGGGADRREPPSASADQHSSSEAAQPPSSLLADPRWQALSDGGVLQTSSLSAGCADAMQDAPPPPRAVTKPAILPYAATWLPTILPSPDVDWRVGTWTKPADEMLAEVVRSCRFNWDAVATEMRSQLRDDARRTAGGGTSRFGGWAPKPQHVTADQVRMRWAAVDRMMCEGRC